ncbi:MAG TPA: CpaF family protein [Chloroflexi bacterium]|jgi:pilus assembly protein CpaF|nr:CpaF family protein [Chloroflexota bacterium]
MMSFGRGSRSTPTAVQPRGEAARNDGSSPTAAVKDRVHRRLLAELSPTVGADNVEEVRRALERIFAETLQEEGLPLSRGERAELFEQIVADILGLGPIEPLLRDDTVTEILVNGPDMVFVERNGILEETDLRFRSADDVLRIIDRIVSPIGRRVDESSPMVDARLPDGSRVNVIIPPLSLVGPCISIRKFARQAYTTDDLVRLGTVPQEWADFLRVCVLARLNIVISGGTSTGKTTFLNMLSSHLPGNERIVTIEDAAELQLQQRHVVRLEARPPNVEGRGEVTIRQLVINALRMRPDRIVVGEVRGGEALDMLQAMNTGHDGSLTTAHSNGARDTLHRIETMVLMAGMDLPLRAVREQIAAAFDLIVHLDRLADGTRKVVTISEVQGMEGDIIVMQDIFKFVQTSVRDGRVEGFFTATGVRPKFMDKVEAAGLFVSPNVFAPSREATRRR